jgi:hypothetical protein
MQNLIDHIKETVTTTQNYVCHPHYITTGELDQICIEEEGGALLNEMV